MSPMTVALIAFVFIFGGALLVCSFALVCPNIICAMIQKMP